ncbi:exodeoxyribonuclease I [Candidatus Saccharibacteria bacterium]|nr:MAG: exodeoxyribonuclease I [Candidatus Saccharibacteria bacterium]
MPKTFFFYDLETSGLNAREARIMQFAGQRTDMDLNPVGEPYNILVKLSDDILPEPGAIMVTGITPQQTLADGVSEAEFTKLLSEEIFTDDTITLGFNSVRFDDEFIRHTLWRNFYDPYEWCWSNGRSRWDMLDVVRLVRALRPEGIKWPVDENGKAVNKLELIAKENNLLHTKAHDALSDVEALIGVAKLIRQKQPKMFEYLLQMRDKREVLKLVNLETPQPFVYASGRYDPALQKTTVAYPVTAGTKPGSLLVWDARHDPTPYLRANPQQLASIIFADREARAVEGFQSLPVKELSPNKCPAVAPMGVLDEAAQKRLEIKLDEIQHNVSVLAAHPEFGEALRTAYEMREPYESGSDVESQLYNGFGDKKDLPRMQAVRGASPDELADFHPDFIDERLSQLLVRYKARNYPQALSDDERAGWEVYRAQKLHAQLPRYLETLQKMSQGPFDTFILEELQLWAESIIPAADS